MEKGETDWPMDRNNKKPQKTVYSLYLFNLHAEYKLRETGLEDDHGLKIGRRHINNMLCVL